MSFLFTNRSVRNIEQISRYIDNKLRTKKRMKAIKTYIISSF